MEGIIKIDISRSELKQGIDVVSFLANTQIFPSKGEARKMVQNGGISINRTKVDNLQLTLDDSLLLHQQYLLIQKGKKNYYLIKAV
jgi:tyrosyl-tRNA synthetase